MKIRISIRLYFEVQNYYLGFVRKTLLITLLAFATQVNAQLLPYLGSRSLALGGCGLLVEDHYSIYNNPGVFSMMENSGIAASFSNRSLIPEFSNEAFLAGIHTEKAGNYGLHFQHFGFNLYRQMQIGITYGMRFHENFGGGVSMNYQQIALGDIYGVRHGLTANLGLFGKASESLSFGMRVINIGRSRLADFENERMPTTFSLGALWAFSEKSFWTLELEKDLFNPLRIRTGFEVLPQKFIALRFGIASFPFEFSGGLGLQLKKFQLDIATSWNSVLGINPGLALSVDL